MSEKPDFNDYFSTQAFEYSRYRPTYPDELFKFLGSLTIEHDTAWDCACGNGQASIGLAEYFNNVIATDASTSQLTHARKHPKIDYKYALAENSGLDSHSINIVTVATAIHWIDTKKLYSEVKRVLKPNGVIAIWIYIDAIVNEKFDIIIKDYSRNLMKGYWTPQHMTNRDFETEIDFPFKKISAPEFSIEKEMKLRDFMNFLSTWSSTQRYIKEHGKNPLDLIYNEMKEAWGDENEKKIIYWPLKLKAGRV